MSNGTYGTEQDQAPLNHLYTGIAGDAPVTEDDEPLWCDVD